MIFRLSLGRQHRSALGARLGHQDAFPFSVRGQNEEGRIAAHGLGGVIVMSVIVMSVVVMSVVVLVFSDRCLQRHATARRVGFRQLQINGDLFVESRAVRCWLAVRC